MPSSFNERSVVTRIIREYPEFKKIIDLGSGWGGMGRVLANNFPENQVHCIELSAVPYCFSRMISLIKRTKTIQYKRLDFFNYSFEEKAVYVCYLSGPVMKELQKYFEKNRGRGSIVISIAFAIPGWKALKVEYAHSALPAPVYLYEF